jgi:hypothetical protein
MEEAIRFRIQLAKNRIASFEKDIESEKDPSMSAWIRGCIAGAKQELNTLEDILAKWEEYQKYGNVVPF